MDGPPNTDRTPVAVREYFRLRLVLRDGYHGEFADLASRLWGDIPNVLHHSALRRPDEPWQIVLLSLDPSVDRESAEGVASNLEALRDVRDVEVQRVSHIIWSDAPFLQREPGRESPDLYAELVLMLFVHDPIGINFDENTDEYEPEVRTIVPRLRSANSVGDVQQIVHEEFAIWFGDETAGPRDRYDKIAADVWQAWQANT